MESRGLLASHRLLSALQKNGVSRKVAHDIVEEAAQQVRSGRKHSLLEAMDKNVLPDTWADESINLEPLWSLISAHTTFGASNSGLIPVCTVYIHDTHTPQFDKWASGVV
jgi:hypothetical protein